MEDAEVWPPEHTQAAEMISKCRFCCCVALQLLKLLKSTDITYLDSEMFVLTRDETRLNVNAQDDKSPTPLLIKDAFLRVLTLIAPKIGSKLYKIHLFQSSVMKMATECKKENWNKSSKVKELMFSRLANLFKQ